MARDITAKVGQTGCPNLKSDITTLQQMLNMVPSHRGGPTPPAMLPTDGQATPQFWAALDKFRSSNPILMPEGNTVAPGSLTMAKLNEFDPLPALTRMSMMMCPHGGVATVISTGKANAVDTSLSANAQCMVNGCPMPDINARCQRIQWMPGTTPNFLDQRSVGMCTSASGAPTGNVIVTRA